MQIELERSSGLNKSWSTLFKKPSYRKRLLFGFATQFIAQSTGVLVVNNYQVLLYKSLGITGSLPLLLNAIYNSLAAFMNFINSLLLDRVGRIKVMLIGLVSLQIDASSSRHQTDNATDWVRALPDLLHSDGCNL